MTIGCCLPIRQHLRELSRISLKRLGLLTVHSSASTLYPRYKYRYVVECDLLEGLLHGYNMGFTRQGIAEVERIIASKQHKTYCTFCAGNCYAYARYLSLEDAVEVANALAALADMGGMWDSREKTRASTPLTAV